MQTLKNKAFRVSIQWNALVRKPLALARGGFTQEHEMQLMQLKTSTETQKNELETSFNEQMSDFQGEWNKKQESFMQKQHNWIERLENTIKR